MAEEVTRKKRPKATKGEKEARTDLARLLLLKGGEPTKIARDISASFKITVRQAWNYIAMARAQIEGILEIDRMYAFAEHVSHRRDMRRRAQDAGDLRMELAVAQDEAKLLQLYPASQIEIKDWRDEARESGVENVEELFEQLVQAAVDRASQGGSVDGS